MSDTTLFSGPPAYVARTGWPPLAAVVATVVIMLGTLILGVYVLSLVDASEEPSNAATLALQLGVQLAVTVLVIGAATLYGSTPRKALALVPPAGGRASIVGGLFVIAVVSGAFSVIALMTRRQDIIDDLTPLWSILHTSDAWLLFLVAAIGAPLSEELVFRGFLQSALARSPLGFWGAALITNTTWTALHAGYSLTGLADVFVFGLVATWLVWRTGSLWPALIGHAVYNGALMIALSQIPLPASA
ncbi:MAG: type II CAAX endopeptidase family protein [Hyphomicrobiaceae bacterium]|nr:type II CAAX endopeptidase family protein [Hyphomicrobiaceae bacterium]